MFIIDDVAKGLYFATLGRQNVKFIANQITHAQTVEFVDKVLDYYLDSRPSKDNLSALKHQIQANLLSDKVAFNGRYLGKIVVSVLEDILYKS